LDKPNSIAAGDLMRGAVPKIKASIEKGLAECDSVLNAISLGASEHNSYRSVLLCRLETQYSLAMMKYCLKLEPAPSKSRINVVWPGDLERVSRLLEEAIEGLRADDYAYSLRSIAVADRILGHMVAKLRGMKIATKVLPSEGVNGAGGANGEGRREDEYKRK